MTLWAYNSPGLFGDKQNIIHNSRASHFHTNFNSYCQWQSPLFSLMAAGQMAMANGVPNGMPLTEYSANPTQDTPMKTSASNSIPPEYLLPDGHPDVCNNS